jgi:pSer/pThr/pTyr-binding forkhead associated (FHA) protein
VCAIAASQLLHDPTLSRSAADRHDKMMLKLRFTDQSREPVWLVDKTFTIGTDEGSHLIIDDPFVNDRHARIIYANNNFLLHDLDSREGTYVNEQRITQRVIQNGDRIKIGPVELEVLDPLQPENQPEWCLVACSSWLSGQEFPICARSQSNDIKIGRASHCDIIFAGTHLSREHASLVIKEDCIWICDLNSANGTFINDVRVTDGAALYSGDLLRLDVYSFRVYGPSSHPQHNPAPNSYDEATKIRRNVVTTPEAELEPSTIGPKRWKTRPTSPGNRSEDTPPKDEFSFTLKAVAAILVLAVIGLVAYLIIG